MKPNIQILPRCRPFLAGLCVASAVVWITIPVAVAKAPNIVFVLCDDLRWDCLGCAGHPHLKTPNIDRLATEGIHFRNAFCTTSLCSPSRASILSGLYAHAHGVTNNFTEYPASLNSFPLQMQRNGYATAYVGKWHMGEENDAERPGLLSVLDHSLSVPSLGIT